MRLPHEGSLGTVSKGYHHNSVIAGKEHGSAPAAAPGAGEGRMPVTIIALL